MGYPISGRIRNNEFEKFGGEPVIETGEKGMRRTTRVGE